MALARRLLGVAAPIDEPQAGEPPDHRPPCPCCGGHMTIIETFARWRQPRAPPASMPPTRENTLMIGHGLPYNMAKIIASLGSRGNVRSRHGCDQNAPLGAGSRDATRLNRPGVLVILQIWTS